MRRIKCTVLYATETGRSKNYANIVKNLMDRSFNCSVYCMEDYHKANLEHEQLVLVVTSTFGSGDPPANGEVRIYLTGSIHYIIIGFWQIFA